jgi:hypothetical protein
MLYIIHRRSIYYGKSIFILKSFMLSKYMPMNIPADPSWYCFSQYLYSSCYLITLSASQYDWFLPSCVEIYMHINDVTQSDRRGLRNMTDQWKQTTSNRESYQKLLFIFIGQWHCVRPACHFACYLRATNKQNHWNHQGKINYAATAKVLQQQHIIYNYWMQHCYIGAAGMVIGIRKHLKISNW